MRLAGLTVPNQDVLELADLLRRGGFTDTADTLEDDVAANRPDIALTILEREAMIWALDDPPTQALAELRAVLLEEHVGRKRDGLTYRLSIDAPPQRFHSNRMR